jgi:transposase InsO family protein
VRQCLVEVGHVLPNLNRQKRRKYYRHEREHSFSLLHGDWHRTSETYPHRVLWLDDASRTILSGGEYGEATTAHSIETLEAAFQVAASLNCEVREVNPDRGAQFFANPRENEVLKGRSRAICRKKVPEGVFQAFLRSGGVRHAVSRTDHPQTNGKIERLWLEYDRHRWRFPSLEDLIVYYNNRIQGSLWWDIAETPAMAVLRKLPQEAMLGMLWRMAEC